MAHSTANFGTLQDFAARQGFDKTIAKIVEMQAATNEILDDMVFTKANAKTAHECSLRTALPAVAWRMMNRGVKPGKSGTKQATFTTGGMEALAKVDEREYNLNGKDDEWRLGENEAHQQAMNKEMAITLFNGDEKINPAKFTGLGAYYFSPDIAKCEAAEYVIDAQGTGNSLTSIYFTVWGQNSMFGIFPDGTSAGFQYRDNGRVKCYDANDGEFYAMESQYNWDAGLVVRDYRYGVRICNIDLATITDTNLINYLIDAHERIENLSAGKAAIYCSRKMRTKIMQLAQNKANVQLGIDDFGGKKLTHFWGIPFRRCDGLMIPESQLV